MVLNDGVVLSTGTRSPMGPDRKSDELKHKARQGLSHLQGKLLEINLKMILSRRELRRWTSPSQQPLLIWVKGRDAL